MMPCAWCSDDPKALQALKTKGGTVGWAMSMTHLPGSARARQAWSPRLCGARRTCALCV